MSGDMYGPADEQESIATIHAALDAGVNLIDTGLLRDGAQRAAHRASDQGSA
jgi:predicted aldo/keto reductase-like oxidoreductase